MYIIEIKKSKTGQWWFRIKGINGKIVASSETYKRRSYCVRIAEKLAGSSEWKIREV